MNGGNDAYCRRSIVAHPLPPIMMPVTAIMAGLLLIIRLHGTCSGNMSHIAASGRRHDLLDRADANVTQVI